MRVRQTSTEPLKPTDYLLILGLPLLFMAILAFGVRSFLVAPPSRDSIKALREGKVFNGMSPDQVIDAVGVPKAEIGRDDGGVTFRYMKSRWNSDGSGFVEEDAYVDFDASGRVQRVEFDSRTPSLP